MPMDKKRFRKSKKRISKLKKGIPPFFEYGFRFTHFILLTCNHIIIIKIMKKVLLIIATQYLISCSKSSENKTYETKTENIDSKTKYTTLYTTTQTCIGDKCTYLLDSINSKYFDISIGSSSIGYQTKKIIEKGTLDDNNIFRQKQLYISDKKHTMVLFKTSTDFLNYMDERGYTMKDQIKYEYRIEYTFIKKED